LPINLKLRQLDGKYIMKKAFHDILPKEIIQRKKQGFTTPRTEWIRNDLKDMAFDLLSKNSVNDRGLFSVDYVEKLKEKASSRGDLPFRPYSYKLMILAFLELWQRIYLDKSRLSSI
jgi:asparagine synthase (glutamine-hydrolysing)